MHKYPFIHDFKIYMRTCIHLLHLLVYSLVIRTLQRIILTMYKQNSLYNKNRRSQCYLKFCNQQLDISITPFPLLGPLFPVLKILGSRIITSLTSIFITGIQMEYEIRTAWALKSHLVAKILFSSIYSQFKEH